MISDTGLFFLAAGYLILAIFVVVERRMRSTELSKSFRRGAFDRGSTLLVGSAFGAGLCLPIITGVLGVGLFPTNLAEGASGIALMALGFGLRVWATSTLGGFYTRTLVVASGHKVVSSGPYSRIRHPGYLGVILMWSGFCFLSSSIVIAVVLLPLLLVAYLYRISVEEKMLLRELGAEYDGYRSRTRRLIPFVY